MPQVTHSVIDPIGAGAVALDSVTVRLVSGAASPVVFQDSDGAEIRVAEQHQLGGTGNTWTLELLPNELLTPAGSHYEITTRFTAGGKSTLAVVVPDGAGPYRALDLLTAATDTSSPIVVGWNPRGTYDPSLTYHLRDVVGYNGKSYVALGTHSAHTPPVTTNSYWQLIGAVEASDGTAPDASTSVKGLARLMGGTATAPTVPWAKLTDVPALAAKPVYRAVTRNTGDLPISAQSVAPADSTGAFDLAVPAAVGDLVLLGLNGSASNEAVSMDFAVRLLSAAAATIRDTALIAAWSIRGNDYFPVSGTLPIVVATGDVPDGMLRLRLLAQVSGATTRQLRASSVVPLLWWAVNHGPAALS